MSSNHLHSYQKTASQIISTYQGEIPLSHFLKRFLSAHKKYGARDRRQISSLCFEHFRNAAAEKLKLLENEFSKDVDALKFARSFSHQPDLFIRIRPGFENIVVEKLKRSDLSYEKITDDCFSFPNSTKLDSILELDREAVIQDANSQLVLDHLKKIHFSERPTVWDCCAASGGKSILAYDILNRDVDIIVSDIRESILANLKKRFAIAGIKKYDSFIIDLTLSLTPNSGHRTPDSELPTPDLIICDAPCTGSGTWARTPEQLYFFDKTLIERYAESQKLIVSNVIPQLKRGGLFFYITCSVFRKENEEVVDFIRENFDLELVQTRLLDGYDKASDSMFAAVLKNPLSS